MQLDEAKAMALLSWYVAVGVDEVIGEAPKAWVLPDAPPPSKAIQDPTEARQAPARSTPHRWPDPAPDQPAGLPTQATQMQARELARRAKDLSELKALLEGFDGCPLKASAQKLVMARGAPDARVMLIGEAPGKDEDMQGVPFVGRAGQLLDRMLAAAGLSPEDVYITNIVFWRPPANRTPTPQEAQACQPFVERQIELVNPKILVFLGSAAAKQLTGAGEGIMKLRGKWLTYSFTGADGQKKTIKAIATLHPAYLLRNPIAKRLAWRDLLLIREALERG